MALLRKRRPLPAAAAAAAASPAAAAASAGTATSPPARPATGPASSRELPELGAEETMAPLAAAEVAIGRYREMWGDVGRCREI